MHWPLENSFIPTKQSVMAKPKLNDDMNDDTSFRYNMTRVSPYFKHNPLKCNNIFLNC